MSSGIFRDHILDRCLLGKQIPCQNLPVEIIAFFAARFFFYLKKRHDSDETSVIVLTGAI